VPCQVCTRGKVFRRSWQAETGETCDISIGNGDGDPGGRSGGVAFFFGTAAYLFSFPKQKQLPTRLHQKSPKEEEKNKLTKQE